MTPTTKFGADNSIPLFPGRRPVNSRDSPDSRNSGRGFGICMIVGADMVAVEAMRFRVVRLSDFAGGTSTDRPQSAGNDDRINPAWFPPRDFITSLVVLPMVGSA
jgi:hypothetical protein